MIIDNLKKANIDALKARNENIRNILSVLLNKIKLAEIANRTTGKQLTDADVTAILLKTQKELYEEKENYLKVNNLERAQLIQGQIEFVESHLPKMLTEQQIGDIIASLADRSIPSVMRHFKENYAGQCDMRTVQMVAKNMQ